MTTDNRPDQATLWIRYMTDSTHAFLLCMGYVTKSSMSFNKSVSVTPIVTKRAEDAFPLDGGTTKSYSFNGYRLQPSSPSQTEYTSPSMAVYGYPVTEARMREIMEEQASWSCEVWHRLAMSAIDRWQMRTDGCDVLLIPSGTNPYTRIGYGSESSAHGYLGSLETTYNADYPELLSYYFTMTVGTMYVSADRQADRCPMWEYMEHVRFDDSYITISSEDRLKTYIVGSLDKDVPSAIESYTIYGGPSEPFERIEMILSVNKLRDVAPDLLRETSDGRAVLGTRIFENKNMIGVNAVGSTSFVVSKVAMTDTRRKIKITGYCPAVVYRDATTIYETLEGTPYEVIDSILSDSRFGMVFSAKRRVMNFDPAARLSSRISFSADSDIWRILQICSVVLGCKMFFANNKVYIIDYRVPKSQAEYPSVGPGSTTETWSRREICTYEDVGDDPAIDLYPPEALTAEQDWMYARTLSAEFGGGGRDSITQRLKINCTTDRNGGTTPFIMTDPLVEANPVDSQAPKTGVLDLPELMYAEAGRVLASDFAVPYLEYMRETQSECVFRVKECDRDDDRRQEWRALFATVSQADSIYSSSTDVCGLVTNRSEYKVGNEYPRMYQKLYLSSYERRYPDMTSTYTWGVINPVDLSNRLSRDL